MSWSYGYQSGKAAEEGFSAQILAIKEGQWTQAINAVKAERDELDRQLRVVEGQLQEQIAYSDDLQRDLDRALQALAKAGANPTERQALSVAPHVRRQKLAEEERLRREKAEEQERQRRLEAYRAALPEMLRRQELERRGRRVFWFLVLTGLLLWGGTSLYGYVTNPKVMSRILENEYVNRVLPLQKPAHVSLDRNARQAPVLQAGEG